MYARAKLSWLFLVVPLILSVNVIGITEAQETHDIAVTSITLNRVTKTKLVNIMVVAKNKGTVNETFNVTLSINNTLIGTHNVTDLASGTNTTLLFVWNTTGISAGTYTVEAVASEVEGETNIANNVLTSPTKVKIISTYVTVVPQLIVDLDLTPGKNFTVSIYTDYNGSDVWSYQFTLNYDAKVLHGVEVTNGDLITEEEDPSALFTPGEFDNNAGELSLTRALFYYIRDTPPFWPANITSGPGTLANVTFEVVGIGDSDITLGSDTKLSGFTEGGYGDIYEIVSDWQPDIEHILPGYFRNTAAEVTHDVAILNVTFSNTTVLEGDLVNITVVVENQGTVAETFTVTPYYDVIAPNYRIATTKTVQNLGAGASTSLTFVWNTMDVTEGSHTIWAEAGTVPGETDTADNRLRSEGMVEVEVSAAAFRTELVIGIVVVVVLIGVAAYVIMRVRRKKP